MMTSPAIAERIVVRFGLLSNSGGATCKTYGLRPRHGFAKTYPMPKITPQAARRDACRRRRAAGQRS